MNYTEHTSSIMKTTWSLTIGNGGGKPHRDGIFGKEKKKR